MSDVVQTMAEASQAGRKKKEEEIKEMKVNERLIFIISQFNETKSVKDWYS